ncbi:MAG: hypothetical protein P8013_02935 [Candidatus Sulfobium sp.]|jgi:hypothetical protein
MANKPRHMKPTDPEMEALKSSFEDGRNMAKAEISALEAKLDAAPWLFRMAGKIEATSFFKSQSEFFRLVMLKQVKDSKDYRDNYGMTWEEFCDSVKVDRRRIDEQLVDLRPFKAEFLADFANFSGVELHKIRYLGQAISKQSSSSPRLPSIPATSSKLPYT